MILEPLHSRDICFVINHVDENLDDVTDRLNTFFPECKLVYLKDENHLKGRDNKGEWTARWISHALTISKRNWLIKIDPDTMIGSVPICIDANCKVFGHTLFCFHVHGGAFGIEREFASQLKMQGNSIMQDIVMMHSLIRVNERAFNVPSFLVSPECPSSLSEYSFWHYGKSSNSI